MPDKTLKEDFDFNKKKRVLSKFDDEEEYFNGIGGG